MLLAEIHRKLIEGAQNNEDALTSCVFGHLRYIPPAVFWEKFFAYAITASVGNPKSLVEVLNNRNIRIQDYSQLRVYFWPTHPKFGEPDLALVFSGQTMRPTTIFIEAKLWAEKSGREENDQLTRYLKAVRDLSPFHPPLPTCNSVALVYLTPRESFSEIVETTSLYGDEANELLFRVQWQDVILAAEESLHDCDSLSGMILSDITQFLRRRELEYFKGFSIDSSLPLLSEADAAFYSRRIGTFSEVEFKAFPIERGAWRND